MISLIEEEIEPALILEAVRRPSCGATVLFLGTVRSPSDGRQVSGLRYETYREMALGKLEEIVKEAESRWELGEVAVVHRLGVLRAGEISLLIAVSSPHRSPAYEASRYLLEEIKKRVPIWKKEYGEGEEKWI